MDHPFAGASSQACVALLYHCELFACYTSELSSRLCAQVPNMAGNPFTPGMQFGSQAKPAPKSTRKSNIPRRTRRSPAKPNAANGFSFPPAPFSNDAAPGVQPEEVPHQPRFMFPSNPHPHVPGSHGATRPSGTMPPAFNAGLPTNLPMGSAQSGVNASQPSQPGAPRPSSRAAAILLHHADRVQHPGSTTLPADNQGQPAKEPERRHRMFTSQRKQPGPKRRSPSRDVPPAASKQGFNIRQMPDLADAQGMPAHPASTGNAFAGLKLDEGRSTVPGSPPELKRVDAAKDRGNAAFSSGLHADAVQHYQRVHSHLCPMTRHSCLNIPAAPLLSEYKDDPVVYV